jgi:hypothetical protein
MKSGEDGEAPLLTDALPPLITSRDISIYIYICTCTFIYYNSRSNRILWVYPGKYIFPPLTTKK